MDLLDEMDHNSEVRYIALELMKLSKLKNIPFKKLAREYIKNVYLLDQMIQEAQEK
ncbi:MAG: hypothetical protein GXN92_01765 [Candidatus Micrarchaeota archaeon]|nr:hypothetical protein [Candidatus Micrarchaeota archaeon]